MSRILVAYASHYGQTQKIATRITADLRQRGHEVELVDARVARDAIPPPSRYDIVVLGSRVEMGRHASELRAYIRMNRDALRDRPTAFFSVSGAAARPNAGADPDGYLQDMFEEVGWRPTRSVAIGGALPYRKYGWLMRFIMKRIARSAGHTTDTTRNHELTNWDDVRAFVDEIAELHAPPVATSRA